MSLIDALGSLLGAGAAAGGSIYAANTAADAAKKAGKTEWAQYLQSRADLAPWREAGAASLADLRAALLGGDMSKFYTSPGYQFRLGQGVDAVNRGASARGGIDSGRTLKALTEYGQGIGASEFNDYINRLAGLSGTGQTATTQTGQFGANAAQGYGNALMQAGALRGSGYASAGNALTGGVNNYLTLQAMKQYGGY